MLFQEYKCLMFFCVSPKPACLCLGGEVLWSPRLPALVQVAFVLLLFFCFILLLTFSVFHQLSPEDQVDVSPLPSPEVLGYSSYSQPSTRVTLIQESSGICLVPCCLESGGQSQRCSLCPGVKSTPVSSPVDGCDVV